MPPRHRIVVARPVPPAIAARIEREFDAIIAADHVFSAAEVMQAVAAHAAEGLVISGTLRLDGQAVAALPETLKVVATTSVGFDHVDVAAAQKRGLMVTNAPSAVTDCTADLAMMLILCVCRRASEYDAVMRAGWRRRFGTSELVGIQASHRTLGILGFGRIGRAVANRARGFGMRVLYHDLRPAPPETENGAQYCADLNAMLPQCQILSLHAPGGPETDSIINAETLALLPRGAVLVNAARGRLVDEEALIAALKSGHLFGAGLDTFRSEPDFDLRLAELPNVFLTPHMGAATAETRHALGERALDNVAAVLSGEPALDPLWA